MPNKQWKQPNDRDRERIEGRLRPEGDCLVWPGWRLNGYGNAIWAGKRWRVHRLVKVWANGNVEHLDLNVLHRCGNRACAKADHLKWGTQLENHADSVEHGTFPVGDDHVRAKLTAAAVVLIWEGYHKLHVSMSALAVEHGCSKALVQRVLDGRAWAHVTQHLQGSVRHPKQKYVSRSKLDPEQIPGIWAAYFDRQLSYAATGKLFGVSAAAVQRIIERRAWADLTDGLTRSGAPPSVRKQRRKRIG